MTGTLNYRIRAMFLDIKLRPSFATPLGHTGCAVQCYFQLTVLYANNPGEQATAARTSPRPKQGVSAQPIQGHASLDIALRLLTSNAR